MDNRLPVVVHAFDPSINLKTLPTAPVASTMFTACRLVPSLFEQSHGHVRIPLVSFSPWWLSILVELCPLEERTAFLARCIVAHAHPHVPPSASFLLLNTAQRAGDLALAMWRVTG